MKNMINVFSRVDSCDYNIIETDDVTCFHAIKTLLFGLFIFVGFLSRERDQSHAPAKLKLAI